jgi:hypothetical protein
MHNQKGLIGSINQTVEIDESMIYKQKSGTGRLLSAEIDRSWIFGGICRETREIFLEFVPKRDASTLTEVFALTLTLQVLHRQVAAGTTVISDSWRAYRKLSETGYTHHLINHSRNFVHPSNPLIHTVVPKGIDFDVVAWYFTGLFVSIRIDDRIKVCLAFVLVSVNTEIFFS